MTTEQNHWPFPMIKPTEKSTEPSGSNLMDAFKRIVVDYRQTLLLQARDQKVGLVHIHDSDYPKGGLTVAFQKSNEYNSGRMVTVAVAVCSPEDTFSRKIGSQQALEKFFNGETIQLPLLQYHIAEDINWAVKQAFTALYTSL